MNSITGEVIQVSHRLSIHCICVQKTMKIAQQVRDVIEVEKKSDDFEGNICKYKSALMTVNYLSRD